MHYISCINIVKSWKREKTCKIFYSNAKTNIVLYGFMMVTK